MADRCRPDRRVTALVAPAGAGKSVLTAQALAAGAPPGCRDVLIDLTEPGPPSLGARIEAANRTCDTGDALDDPSGLATALGADDGPVCLHVDGSEHLTPADIELLDRLAAHGPSHLHLVVAGRVTPAIGLPAHLAGGRAASLGPAELALTPRETTALAARLGGPAPVDGDVAAWPLLANLSIRGRDDLAAAWLTDLLAATCTDAEHRLLAAAAALGGLNRSALEVVAATLAPGTDPDRSVWPLPLIDTHPDGLWPHEVWVTATRGVLDTDERLAAARAVARHELDRGDLATAGRLAREHGDAATAGKVLRAAMATIPPRLPATALRDLAQALPADTLERRWALGSLTPPGPDGTADAALRAVRDELAAGGDVDGELAVLLLLGQRARRRRDPLALLELIERSRELAAAGTSGAAHLAALGDAISHQMTGDHQAAIDALAGLGSTGLGSDLGAQVLMVRATNLLFLGRTDDAVHTFTIASGVGSRWSRAVANDLLGTARWLAGDAVAAVDAARMAADLADAEGATYAARDARAMAACYLAAADAPDAERAIAEVGALDDEPAGQAGRVAAALMAVAGDDLDGARAHVAVLLATDRPSPRTRPWTIAMAIALDLLDPPTTTHGGSPAVDSASASTDQPEPAGRLNPDPDAAATAAGVRARTHLAGGPPVADPGRPFLPASWCTPDGPRVDLRLLGPGVVHRRHRRVDPPQWRRGRVRELCLHLAVVRDASRSEVAAALWPELDRDAALTNLRATLRHLLDVLDPDRSRGAGSRVLIDDPHLLALADPPTVHVDLRSLGAATATVVTAARRADTGAAIGAARRLVELAVAVPLVGTELGDWWGPHHHDLVDRMGRAGVIGADLAVAEGLTGLAEELGWAVLRFDPWAEAAHRIVIGARGRAGDADGARRAARNALDVLAEVDGPTDPETVRAIRRTGVRLR